MPDGGPVRTDAGPCDPSGAAPPSLAHCDFAALAPTARAGGTVTAGALMAGAAEAVLDLPVGSGLGAYTARASGLGPRAGIVDRRYVEIAESWNPSVGIETRMMAKAVALTAGDETIVLIKLDLGIGFEGATFEVERQLGPEFAGKVFLGVSHSHSAWGHFTANEVYQLGAGEFRRRTFDHLVDTCVAVARAALAAQEPARLGVTHDPDFDPEDRVNRDRREENDDLAGGPRDDRDLYVLRVDATDGSPIALVAIFGMHGTIQGEDNNLASTDAPGAVERALEEQLDETVVVMHLQGAGGDVSPAGSGGTDCRDDNVCYDYARDETVGRYAVGPIMAAYGAAMADMRDSLAIEAVTQSIVLGPDWTQMTIRDGALEYAPWDGECDADGQIWADPETRLEVLSPIDEFNAPFGAGLCGEDHTSIFPLAQLPGTERVPEYSSCMTIPVVAEVIEEVGGLPFSEFPVCGTTRTTIQAIRIGDYMLAAFPGEVTTLYADLVRSYSPFDDAHTIPLGYAHGEMGYLLVVEDWLRAGYESSINVWGPLQGEYIAERARGLMELAATDTREDAASMAEDAWVTPALVDDLPPPDPAPMAGTVPATVPADVYIRDRIMPMAGQPTASVRRLESAYFVWIGEDPLEGTPTVVLEREPTGGGPPEPVRRRSGRRVEDGDILLFWTPLPLIRTGTSPRTHYWVAEWQAVTPWGTPGLDDVEDRPGVPLGRYRFRVEGTGYEVASNLFDVVPAALVVTASRSGTTISAQASYSAPTGFRLLHMTQSSNDPVALSRGPVTVELDLGGSSTRTFPDLTPDAGGNVSVNAGADAAATTSVRVIDRFGNAGSATP